MIPNKSDIVVTGDLGGEKITMGFDEESIPFLMNLLTNLYSDNILACIREYSTNAYDSHVEAGNPMPIEVTTPGPLSAYFTVRDYGIGMDSDSIRKIYSQYGKSTKRGSNDFNGMLGVGSKSALAYTQQFMVTGWKNGIKTIVAVSRAESGAAVCEIISCTPSDEATGVEIKIPSSDHDKFSQKAEFFFGFWKSGTVLLNGEDPQHNMEEISEGIYINDLDNSYVVMGNVAYPAQGLRLGSYYGAQTNFTCYVNIGDLDFAPSREEFVTNEKSANLIMALKGGISSAYQSHIENKVASATTYGEAFRYINNVMQDRYIPNISLSWNGHSLRNFDLVGIDEKETYPVREYKGVNIRKGGALASYMYESFVIINYSAKSGILSSSAKNRVTQYIDDRGLPKHFAVTHAPGLAKPEQTKDIVKIDWNDILASTDKPVVQRAPRKKFDGKFMVYSGSNGTSREEITSEHDVIYIPLAEYRKKRFGLPYSASNYPDYKFVVAGAIDLKRLKAVAKSVVDYLEFQRDVVVPARAKKEFEALSDRDIILEESDNAAFALTRVHPFQVDDPMLKRIVGRRGYVSDIAKSYEGYQKIVEDNRDAIEYNPLTDYPLLRYINSHSDSNHIAEYLNLKYRSRNDA